MKRPKFLLFGCRRPRDLAKPSLSPLERKVMKKVWGSTEVSVRDVYLHVGERVPYTTLMTVMDRLYKQDLLLRRKLGKAFLYSPALSREQLEDAVRKGIIDSLLRSDEDVESALSCIVDKVSKAEPRPPGRVCSPGEGKEASASPTRLRPVGRQSRETPGLARFSIECRGQRNSGRVEGHGKHQSIDLVNTTATPDQQRAFQFLVWAPSRDLLKTPRRTIRNTD